MICRLRIMPLPFFTQAAAMATLLATFAFSFVVPAYAADLWVNATDAVVITNNDCGFITATHGGATIRRSFHAAGDPGVAAHTADRVNSGDELVAPPGGRIEMVSGGNIVLVAGDNSRVRLNGLRTFTGPLGNNVTRLDLEVVSGEARVQVRLNEEKAECVLAALNGAEVLVRRGDIVLYSQSGWLASSISGEVMGRVKRGAVVGAPFIIGDRRSVGGDGDAALDDSLGNAMRARLPFSFELVSAALPPAPSMGSQFEAP